MELFWDISVPTVATVLISTLIFVLLPVVFILCIGAGAGYEYLLLNIVPGTSQEDLQQHLRSKLQSKLNNCDFGKTTAHFTCRDKLSPDEWEKCEKFREHWLTLVQKKSDMKFQCSQRSLDRVEALLCEDHAQIKVKPITYHDTGGSKFQGGELYGKWTAIIVLLDRLPNSGQCFSREDDFQKSYGVSVTDETTRPLLGKSNKNDRQAKRQDIGLDIVQPEVIAHCDSYKRESLNVDEDLYRYALRYHKGDMEVILSPKPFSSEFKSGNHLILVGQACLVAKAAEDMAVFCQGLTARLDKDVFKLSECISTEEFRHRAELCVATPNRTMLLPLGNNTFKLYGPKDKLKEVSDGLKNLENELKKPAVRDGPHNLESNEKKLIKSEYRQQSHGESSRSSFPVAMEKVKANKIEMENELKKPAVRDGPHNLESNEKKLTKSEYRQQSHGESSRSSFPIAMEKVKANKIEVSVFKGDLTKQTTDVIVNPANYNLQHGGGAAKAIADAVGQELHDECRNFIKRYGHLDTGKVMHTTAGNLSPRIKYVIHAAGPSASKYPVEKELERKLEETFFNCLRYANDELEAKSISIPAISSGIFGVRKELVARAARSAVKQFEQQRTGQAVVLEKVSFVNIDDESTDAFLEVFGGTRSRKASLDVHLGKTGSVEGAKSRSKSLDQPKRKRVLIQKVSNSLTNQEDAGNSLSNGVVMNLTTATVANGDESEDCVICMETMTSPKTLPCGHKFCDDCIKDSFEKCQPKCPSCGRLFGVMRGNQPPGKMYVETISKSLSGYDGYKTIVVDYEIPSGIQNDSHPNPGVQYHGTHRVAYLPDSKEGREVCDLLRKAFDAGLIFTVGRSTTTARDNQVIWNDIHHKTSEVGTYGYPDPNYLTRVKEELKAKGIVSEASDHKPKQTVI